jgi:hypothetical protein
VNGGLTHVTSLNLLKLLILLSSKSECNER